MPDEQTTQMVRDLLITIAEIDEFKRGDKAFLSETWFHKLLYDLKRRIDDQEIKNVLQFYWYIHGPFSEDIRCELQGLAQDKIFESVSTLSGNSYRLKIKPKKTEMKSIAIAGKVLEQIYAENNPYNLRSLMKTIYLEAPYKFMPQYKFNYLDSLKELKMFIEQDETQTFIENYNAKVIDNLYEAESLLPSNRLYGTYNQVFGNMVGEITALLTLSAQHDIYAIESAIKLSEEAWECFAKGVRIEKHDPVYTHRKEAWSKNFEDSLSGFANMLALFSQQQLKNLGGYSTKPTQEPPPSIGVMRAIVLGYLNE
ncbi:Uncharacterised protein [uncultured archaeon]|nr:Uncharacterised protein [uncultured archaeon]